MTERSEGREEIVPTTGARAEQADEVADIVWTEHKKAWPDLHPVLDLRYGIADALWNAGYRKVLSGVEVVREFLDADGQGYVIEHSEHGYRYVWREIGEPDDEGVWFATEPGAIEAAWEDWDTNGQGYHWAPWSKKLAKVAGYKEPKA